MATNKDNLIWIDLEMTGLSPKNDVIIEIATIMSDKNLNILAKGPVFAIYQPDEVLNKMDKWNTKQHGNSGLVSRVKKSTTTVQEAEQKTIEFLKQFVKKGISPMCGSSICQDRRFLANEMPKLEKYFHYRHIDVSTIKELVKRWKPNLKISKKKSEHLALADIKDSINELKYYKE